MRQIEYPVETMYRLLEICDGYEMLQDISDVLIGCRYSAGYDEGVLGKLARIVKLIVDRADPSLYDRYMDFHDTELALILDDKKIDNHLKAEMLVGSKR